MEKYDEILSAKAWIIMNFKTGSYMRGLNVQKQREIASLTKMYTLYACLKINKLLNINPDKTFVKIHELVTSGTTANLLKNRYISIRDLYYGMMLPSGNDAAALLAFYYGHWLEKENMFPNLIFTKLRKIDLKDRLKYCNLLIKRFMFFVNESIIKDELKHSKTKLENPNGLSNKFQVSTAWEVAEAGIHFMKNEQEFRDIVRTKKYSGFYFSQDPTEDIESFSWENTNILLNESGFEGIKTGHTSTAGSCLCTYKTIQIKERYDYELIVVVLNCNNQEKRFSETKILCEDLESYLKEIID